LSGLALIWVLVGINIAGMRESGIVTLVTTILKLIPLVLVGIVGLWFIDAENLPKMHPGEGNALLVFASIFALSFWNFAGIEIATVPAEDAVDPVRTIPRALLAGTLTVGAVYLLVSFVTMGVMPASVLVESRSPLADVGTRLFGSLGSGLIVAGALVSTVGSASATILEGGQYAMAAGRDRLFPDVFSKLSRRHTPWVSYVLMGSLASLLLVLNFSRGLVAAYEYIILIATLTLIIPYAFSAIAGLLLQLRDPAGSVTKAYGEAIVAILAFGVCFWVIAASGMEAVYWVFLLMMIGMPVYLLVGWRNTRKSSVSRGDAEAVSAPNP
jgi:APA family basic amino acid/polyamine antiporter